MLLTAQKNAERNRNRKEYSLHFLAFSGVASLIVIGVENKKVGVDNRKRGVDNKKTPKYFLDFLDYLDHPKMQQDILLHSSMIMPDIGLNQGFQRDGTRQCRFSGQRDRRPFIVLGQRDKLKILPWDRTGWDSQSKSGPGCGTGQGFDILPRDRPG